MAPVIDLKEAATLSGESQEITPSFSKCEKELGKKLADAVLYVADHEEEIRHGNLLGHIFHIASESDHSVTVDDFVKGNLGLTLELGPSGVIAHSLIDGFMLGLLVADPKFFEKKK